MNITMKTNITNIHDITHLLKVAEQVSIERKDTKEGVYRWVEDTLVAMKYLTLKRKEKGRVLRYLSTYSNYSPVQIKRLVQQYQKTGRVRLKKRTQPQFPVKYTTEDIALLAEVADVYRHMNGKALKEVCREMYEVYGDTRFSRLQHISVSHLYNLKKKEVFRTYARHFNKTKKSTVSIGERRKPCPAGKPGYIRVDSVHQGDREGEKGVYHINLVDEVTQYQTVCCVESISEKHLLPVLKEALALFPFTIRNFHSDNGSEYINHRVAELLEKLRITQTKGRSRRCNDNALVESKNASTVRKHLGHHYIPKKYAEVINNFYKKHFNDFLNFHRFCAFPEEEVLPSGKIIKHYREYKTPIQKLLSLPNVEVYLKEGVTVEMLQKKAQSIDHITAASNMQKAKQQLFT